MATRTTEGLPLVVLQVLARKSPGVYASETSDAYVLDEPFAGLAVARVKREVRWGVVHVESGVYVRSVLFDEPDDAVQALEHALQVCPDVAWDLPMLAIRAVPDEYIAFGDAFEAAPVKKATQG